MKRSAKKIEYIVLSFLTVFLVAFTLYLLEIIESLEVI
jgi:hypothetical protein